MRRCPITYEEIGPEEKYSQRGLHGLSPQLKNLKPLPFTANEQQNEAMARVGKMSIQGVQPKISAQLKVSKECFEIVDMHGPYILKPQNPSWDELPQNEAITMTLAAWVKIDVPLHGLLYSKDSSMTYFVKRFDRVGRNKKIALEDFSQLQKMTRQTKYGSSMERVIQSIADYCTFPKVEFVKLFKLTLFNYLIGNEDMHLKNFSLITRNQKVELSPAYDLLNTTIAIQHAKEEIALPLNGKKRKLTTKDLLIYFPKNKLELNQNIIDDIVEEIKQAQPLWESFIRNSFLSKIMQERYLELLEKRRKIIRI